MSTLCCCFIDIILVLITMPCYVLLLLLSTNPDLLVNLAVVSFELTWPGGAHLSLVPLVLPPAHLPLHLCHLLPMSARRGVEPEDEGAASVVQHVVDEGSGQQEEHEDPAVVHDDVLQPGRGRRRHVADDNNLTRIFLPLLLDT